MIDIEVDYERVVIVDVDYETLPFRGAYDYILKHLHNFSPKVRRLGNTRSRVVCRVPREERCSNIFINFGPY